MNLGEIIRQLRSSGRLNPNLRAILFILSFLVASGVFGFLMVLVLLFVGFSDQREAIVTLSLVVQTAIAFALAWLFRTKLDRMSFASFSLNLQEGWFRDLFWGMGVGVVAISAVIGIGSLFGYFAFVDIGWDKVSPVNLLSWGLLVAFWMILAGLNEELVARGYLLQNFSAGTNIPAGVIISSLAFAAGHFGNPDASLVAVLNLFLAGVFFAVVYFLRQSLWAPIGAHFAWNFFQGYVFGENVSGLDILSRYALFHFEPFGPDLATGGAFGPEASLITTLVLITAIVVLLRRVLAASKGTAA